MRGQTVIAPLASDRHEVRGAVRWKGNSSLHVRRSRGGKAPGLSPRTAAWAGTPRRRAFSGDGDDTRPGRRGVQDVVGVLLIRDVDGTGEETDNGAARRLRCGPRCPAARQGDDHVRAGPSCSRACRSRWVPTGSTRISSSSPASTVTRRPCPPQWVSGRMLEWMLVRTRVRRLLVPVLRWACPSGLRWASCSGSSSTTWPWGLLSAPLWASRSVPL